jgi:hypothetical protein
MLDRRGNPSLLVAVVAVAAWIAAVSSGFAMLWRYKSKPALAADGAPPARWPDDTQLRMTSRRSTLLLFAHPLCPCTRASVSELARLVPRLGADVSTLLVVVRPDDPSTEWARDDLERQAAAIPGVEVVRDDGGFEAQRFHATASGHALLYDADGRLRFSGGITAARGHEGESFGQRRIVSIVRTGRADRESSPVFGCALPRRDGTGFTPREGARE